MFARATTAQLSHQSEYNFRWSSHIIATFAVLQIAAINSAQSQLELYWDLCFDQGKATVIGGLGVFEVFYLTSQTKRRYQNNAPKMSYYYMRKGRFSIRSCITFSYRLPSTRLFFLA